MTQGYAEKARKPRKMLGSKTLTLDQGDAEVLVMEKGSEFQIVSHNFFSHHPVLKLRWEDGDLLYVETEWTMKCVHYQRLEFVHENLFT